MAPPLRPRAALRLDAEDRVLALFLGFRAFGSPVIAGAAWSFAFLDGTPWRRRTLLAMGVLVVLFSVIEQRRFERVGPRAFLAPLDLLAVTTAHLTLVFASGALGSPFTPTLLLVAFFQGLVGRTWLGAWQAAALQVPAVWAMAWAHATDAVPGLVPSFLVGHLAPAGSGGGPWVYALVLTVPLLVAPQVARTVRERLDRTYLDALTARDRSLALYADQAQTLTRLAAEIAHELKNPLASIKGLGALLARDATGRAVERIAVLRREADRMQRVLDEMLEFGRPLVPLDVTALDLADLAREVVTLHEGMAAARGVRLVAEAPEPAASHGDARKVLQVLTNLVQNALEAAPPGSVVAVRAEPGALRVRDEGPGLDPAVAGRVFDAGVTTKAQGTGLGLTIARTLARQHGGELVLAPRADGAAGCEAVFTLPLDGDALRRRSDLAPQPPAAREEAPA